MHVVHWRLEFAVVHAGGVVQRRTDVQTLIGHFKIFGFERGLEVIDLSGDEQLELIYLFALNWHETCWGGMRNIGQGSGFK